MKVCAVLFALNDYENKFPFWFQNSTKTFKKWNPDIELKVIKDGYIFDNKLSHIFKCVLDLMENEGYTKIIVLEADTITCGPFTEFLEESNHYFYVTQSYGYSYSDKLLNKNLYVNQKFGILEIETMNPGIFSVNSLDAAKLLMNLQIQMDDSFEQVLNFILYNENFTHLMKVLGFPYALNSFVYNQRFLGVRSLEDFTEDGNVKFCCDSHIIVSHLSPFKRLFIHDEKLLNHDGKWIKCIHIASHEPQVNLIKGLDKKILEFLEVNTELPYKQ